jgi:ABC-type antimicrobial peptide transport system permease subunit
MLKNYLITAIRNLRNHKLFSIINIAGLVIAFTSCIFIALYVLDELEYDQFHKNTNQIFRVRQKVDLLGYSPTTSFLLAGKLKDEFAEVIDAARVQPMDDPIYFKVNNQLMEENNYLFADNSVFQIFTFPLASGNSKLALSNPNSVVINKKIAKKYFGNKNPLGEALHINIRSKWYDIQVAGVLENIPANLSPLKTIKNKSMLADSRSGLRKKLIVIQFAIFVTLLVCSIVIFRQLNYYQEANLGFNKEHLIAINMGRTNFAHHFNSYKNDVIQNPSVVDVSAGSLLPMTETAIMFKSVKSPDNPENVINYYAGFVDYDFFKTLAAEVIQGRVFSRDYSQDLVESVVINQTAAQKFGLGNQIGKLIQLNDGPKRVIGIVNDFIVSCYYETPPLVYYLKPGNPIIGTIILRIRPENLSATLKFLESKWYSYAPDAVFTFQFVDEEINRQYIKDMRFGKIITTFTGLTILIASLGMFGLSLFMIKRRNKEFGIRKILGASMRSLVILQTKEMIYLAFTGSIIAIPIAYYLMNKWLQDFAYRINISWWMFVLSGGIALVIALATVSFQAIKAATANPVKSLRYE